MTRRSHSILWQALRHGLCIVLPLLTGAVRGGAQGLVVNVTVTQTPTCGNANGAVTIVVIGGVQPYLYSMDFGIFVSTNQFGNLAGGMHTVTVVDAASNVSTYPFSIGDILGPQVMVNPIAASCLNNDGEVDIVASFGTLPYMYSIG